MGGAKTRDVTETTAGPPSPFTQTAGGQGDVLLSTSCFQKYLALLMTSCSVPVLCTVCVFTGNKELCTFNDK